MAFLSSHMKPVAALGLAALVSGCSALNIGEPNYSCSGMPDGVQCMSTRDVYAATNDGNIPTPMSETKQSRLAAQPEATSTPTTAGGENPNDVVSNYVAPRLPDQPVPVRTPAEVMRIWIAPWEDDNGDLVVTGYLYTEIEPRRWVIGDQAPTVQPTLRPLQSVQTNSQQQSGN